MRVVSAAEIDRVLDYPNLIAALRAAFQGRVTAPPRHHHAIARPGGEATLLLMPAWQEADAGGAGFIGVKLVSVFPDNATRAKPSVIGTYLLMAGDSGEALAALDGVALTLWRTAADLGAGRRVAGAAGGIASRHDRRGGARTETDRGHATVRPITTSASGTARPAARSGWPPHSTGRD